MSRYSILALLVDFMYQGYVNGSQDELLILFQYAKELQLEGLVNSSQNTKPVISDLIDTRSAARMELKKLQTISSDSETCSSEDEDISILYENLERDQRSASSSQAASEKVKKTQSNIVPPNHKIDPQTTSSNPRAHPSEQRQPEAANPRKKQKLTSSNPVPNTNSTQKSKPSAQPSNPTTEPSIRPGTSLDVPKEPVSKPIKCSVCKQVFTLKHQLRVHLTLNHAEILTCRICDKLFQSQASLKRHIHHHIAKLDIMIGNARALQPNSANQK